MDLFKHWRDPKEKPGERLLLAQIYNRYNSLVFRPESSASDDAEGYFHNGDFIHDAGSERCGVYCIPVKKWNDGWIEDTDKKRQYLEGGTRIVIVAVPHVQWDSADNPRVTEHSPKSSLPGGFIIR